MGRTVHGRARRHPWQKPRKPATLPVDVMLGRISNKEREPPRDNGGRDMFNRFAFRLFAACAACLAWQEAAGQAVAVEPPYQIILRSRNGVVTPERNKNGQTG